MWPLVMKIKPSQRIRGTPMPSKQCTETAHIPTSVH